MSTAPMPPVERRVVVASPEGLHARPAALFCKAASAQPVPVTVARADGDPVDARSVFAVMKLGVLGGQEVVLRATGQGAEQAVEALAALLATDHPAADHPAADHPATGHDG